MLRCRSSSERDSAQPFTVFVQRQRRSWPFQAIEEPSGGRADRGLDAGRLNSEVLNAGRPLRGFVFTSRLPGV